MGLGPLKIAGRAGLLALLAACGSAATREAKGGDDSRVPPLNEARDQPCARERARAAELAQRAEAVTPPEVPPHDDKGASLAFIKGPVAQWVRARRAAVDKADAAHEAALACTPNDERARLLLERGRLQSRFATTFLRLGEAAVPPQLLATPEMKHAVLSNLSEVMKPQLERARASFEQCVALGNQAAPADVAACSSEIGQLPQQPAGPASATASGESEPKRPARLAYPRPFVATSQPKPCTFAGTLKLWLGVLTVGSREAARIQQVEVRSLTLPTARSGPFVIETAWPIRGTFTLSASALPLNLRSRIDLVRNHIWLSEGAAVSAAATPGGALAYRPLAKGAEIAPDPAVKVACSELELAGRIDPKDDDTKRERVNFKGSLALSDAPGGSTIGTVTFNEPNSFVLLGRQNGWLHIQDVETPFRGFQQPWPYDLDAWTRSTPTDETAWGMIGLLSEVTPPTHISTAELALYADPSPSQPVGKLVKDVPLLVGETRGEYMNVIVPGVAGAAADQPGFWAKTPAVKASVRAQ